jgi:hypothetical protein
VRKAFPEITEQHALVELQRSKKAFEMLFFHIFQLNTFFRGTSKPVNTVLFNESSMVSGR